MSKVLSLQQLRRELQTSGKKAFEFESEEQPLYKPMCPIEIKMVCWFSEVWPQTNVIVMQSNAGEVVFKDVQYVVRHDNSPVGDSIYTIHCANRTSPNKPTVFQLSEYQ